MNLKVAFIVILYWTIWIAILTVGGANNSLTESGVNQTGSINTSDFGQGEIDSGGIFSGTLGVFTSIGRFIGLTFFGIGLPSDYPLLLRTLFALWATGWTLLTIGLIIDSVWSG